VTGPCRCYALSEDCQIAIWSRWRVAGRRIAIAIAGMYTNHLSKVGRKRYWESWIDARVGGCSKDDDASVKSVSYSRLDQIVLSSIAQRYRNDVYPLFYCPSYCLRKRGELRSLLSLLSRGIRTSATAEMFASNSSSFPCS
jgi:hypothetical protein